MRKINDRFINDLLFGELSYFLDQVKGKRESLSMEIRNDYVSIYYKGGSLLKIAQNKKGYKFKFDAKYCKNKGDDSKFTLLNGLKSDDITAFKMNFHLMIID